MKLSKILRYSSIRNTYDKEASRREDKNILGKIIFLPGKIKQGTIR